MSDPCARRRTAGFTMIELLLTVVLTGIIFAAVMPLFLNVLARTSDDAHRNDAQYIAQDRLEQVRLLPYATLAGCTDGGASDVLNNPPSSTFGDGKFGPYITLAGQNKPYRVTYQVTDSTTEEGSVAVKVTVQPWNTTSTTTLSTIVKNPAPHIVSVDEGGNTGPLPTTNLTITVSFKNWADVVQSSSKGVFWTRTNTDGTGTITSSHIWPTSSTNSTVTFTGLNGGTGYTYTVSCYSSKWQSGGTPFTSPPFHLLKSARLKFDTNPGGS
jgi:type II secretory pathway pseudopilin PulG